MLTFNRATTAIRTSINSSLRCYSSKNENITSQFEDKDGKILISVNLIVYWKFTSNWFSLFLNCSTVEEFRVLNIYNKSQTTTREARRQRYKQNFVPRSQSMSTDQEWVWSGELMLTTISESKFLIYHHHVVVMPLRSTKLPVCKCSSTAPSRLREKCIKSSA